MTGSRTTAAEIAINGAGGRMGETLLETAAGRDDVTATVGIAPDPDTVGGVPAYTPGEAGRALAEHAPDAVIDFSTPAGTANVATACVETEAALVVGTTGHGDDERAALAEASETVPVLTASNFSRGIQALQAALEAALDSLPGYDVEVLETHHNGKRDAPSGTAEALLETIGTRREVETVAGREGIHPRSEPEVGMLVRRAGNVRGEHEVLLAGNDEVLTLTHRAEDRAVFAAGAIDAAARIVDWTPGQYSFADVITES